MTLDPVLLSRLQWVWVISWHILLPAFTVGLASYVAVLEGFYFFTERPIWLRLSTFWTNFSCWLAWCGRSFDILSMRCWVPALRKIKLASRNCHTV